MLPATVKAGNISLVEPLDRPTAILDVQPDGALVQTQQSDADVEVQYLEDTIGTEFSAGDQVIESSSVALDPVSLVVAATATATVELPEPSTIVMMGLGAAAVLYAARRRRKVA